MPTDIPSTIHWYTGDVPSPVTTDVRLILLPSQIVAGLPEMAIVGTMASVVVMESVVGTAHCPKPAPGVNVYIAVPETSVFIVVGLHTPVIPLRDVVSNAGAVLFWQSGPMASNVGVISEDIVIFIVATAPHWPGSGVNV